MIEIISGEKGKGKTKHLIQKANEAVGKVSGNVVYVDKSSKHMYELDSKIRLINTADFDLESMDEFLGFLSGIVSQNSDIEEIYLDSFLTIGFVDTNDGLIRATEKLEKISGQFEVKFIVSISKNEEDLPDSLKSKIIISL